MSKGQQRYAFIIRRGQDGGYVVELDNEPHRSLGVLEKLSLFHVARMFVVTSAKAAGDKVAELLVEGEKEGD
jgi:hypothetical protein